MRWYFFLINITAGLAALTACGGSSDGPQPMTDNPVTHSETDNYYSARDIAERLDEPLVRCPERIWPGLGQDYHDAQILITDDSGDEPEAYLWRSDGTDIEVLDAAALPEVWFASYAFSEYRGQRTLGFNISAWDHGSRSAPESLIDTPIDSLFHESFHLFVDDPDRGWSRTSGDRDGEYPIQWQPRYLRAKLMQSLEKALLEGDGVVDDEDLAAASYWYDRHLSEHADEAARIVQTDRSEGAAEYADNLMTAIAELGCEASDDDLAARAIELGPSTRHRESPSAESYVIGFVAGMLLRERGPRGWERRVERGETFHGILLEGISPEPQPEDEALQQEVQNDLERRNEELEDQIGSSLDRWRSEDYHRLVIDSAHGIGSFRREGSLRLVEEPLLKRITLKRKGHYDHGATVTLNRINTFDIDGSPCGVGFAGPILVLVPESDMTLQTDGTADSTSGLVQFSGLEVETVVWQEREWLCPLE